MRHFFLATCTMLLATCSVGCVDQDPRLVPEAQPAGPCPYGTCPASELFALSSRLTPQASSLGELDLPPELREPNWGGGSCVHASTVMLLRRQGLYEMADWWRQAYIGGETGNRLISRLDAAGLHFAYTEQADLNFLRWAVKSRRWAGIFYKPSHAINCVDIDEQYVYLLDNNDIHRPERDGVPERVPIAEFQARWQGYGGFAWTAVYTPQPPAPRMISNVAWPPGPCE